MRNRLTPQDPQIERGVFVDLLLFKTCCRRKALAGRWRSRGEWRRDVEKRRSRRREGNRRVGVERRRENAETSSAAIRWQTTVVAVGFRGWPPWPWQLRRRLLQSRDRSSWQREPRLFGRPFNDVIKRWNVAFDHRVLIGHVDMVNETKTPRRRGQVQHCVLCGRFFSSPRFRAGGPKENNKKKRRVIVTRVRPLVGGR